MRCLIVFAREPLPGRVKSRLAASIGADAAAVVYQAMLQDVLDTCRGLERVEVVIFWDCAAAMLTELEKRYGFRSLRQSGADLGERMHNAFTAMFAEGAKVCCIIGTDTPDLPPELIGQAFAELEADGCDALFGPARDGGYYLLGLRTVQKMLFEDIPWGSGTVLEKSLERAEASGLRTARLPTWHDVDTMDDLEYLLTRTTDINGMTGRVAAHLGLGGTTSGREAGAYPARQGNR